MATREDLIEAGLNEGAGRVAGLWGLVEVVTLDGLAALWKRGRDACAPSIIAGKARLECSRED